MINPEELKAFEDANIHKLIASQHDAEWAQVIDVHNEIEVVRGRDRRQYMAVRWEARNGHRLSGDYKIFGEHTHGFDENQLTILGAVAMAADPPVRRYVG